MGFFTKDIKTLDDLFVHTLRDIYYAEQQIAKSLPDMIGKALRSSIGPIVGVPPRYAISKLIVGIPEYGPRPRLAETTLNRRYRLAGRPV